MAFDSLLDSFLIMLALIAAAIWLRRWSIIKESDQAMFARLVTDFALPALIFANLSQEPLDLAKLKLALVLFLSIASVMIVAWVIGGWMSLERPVLGSVVLVSGVGSTATLGYVLIQRIFGDDSALMSDLLVMVEFGVELPLFTLGVMVASYFGAKEGERVSAAPAMIGFFRSPIFLALVLGITMSAIGLPENHRAVRLLNDFASEAGSSLSFLVAFTIGLMLRPVAIVKLSPLLLLVAFLKLALEPFLAGTMALWFSVPEMQRSLLIVEAAMPSGALAAVIAARYGCDGAVASILLIATFGLSLLAIPLIAYVAL